MSSSSSSSKVVIDRQRSINSFVIYGPKVPRWTGPCPIVTVDACAVAASLDEAVRALNGKAGSGCVDRHFPDSGGNADVFIRVQRRRSISGQLFTPQQQPQSLLPFTTSEVVPSSVKGLETS